jgi:hypothetical protein
MTKGDPPIAFLVGKGGWTQVGWEGRTDLVRFALNPDKKTWRIDDVQLHEPTGETFRSFPFARIESAANAHSIVALGLAIGHTQKPPRDIASMFRGQKPVPLNRLRLKRPQGRRLDASFYKQVALAYKGALAEGLKPRQTLARDSGAAPDTVARWIATARSDEYGYLPKTTPGKASAYGEVE